MLNNKENKASLPTQHGKPIPTVFPDPKIKELFKVSSYNSVTWKMFKIMAEFVDGFEMIRKYKKAVTIFGSSRYDFDHRVYEETRQLAFNLSKAGFEVVTGGGPGVMEAANKGAKEEGGKSIGLNINLPVDENSRSRLERRNEYLTESEAFDYFFVRKTMLSFASQAYIFFPGGFGTLDELFEMITLVQTHKLWEVPIILIDKEYWQGLIDWLEKVLYEKNKAIDKKDMQIYTLVKDANEAYDLIVKLDREGKIRGKKW